MKTLFSCLAITALIIMSSFTVNQQQQLNQEQTLNSCFSNFRIHREGKAGVTLNWAIAAPDVSQFVVERSYDGEFFESLSNVGFNGSATYKFKDNQVFPGFIYYRITAIHSDGTTEQSSVEMIRIVQRG